jgi:hypothetical protein
MLLGRRLKHLSADLEFLEQFRTTYDQWATDIEAESDSKTVADRRPSPRRRSRVRR